MFFFLIYAYSFYTLLATAYAGVLPYGCNQGTEGQDLTDALNDVEIVAKAAVAALASGKINGKEDVFQSAYDPLFLPEDRIALGLIFAQISTIQTGPLRVFIFCTENHVVRYKDRPSNWWHDEQFISIPTGRTMGVPIAKGVFKPGVKGSYTTIGYKINDKEDCSGHAHIYLAHDRRHPPQGLARDLRRYPDIVKDGIDARYAFIEDIKPLAQTVLHELIHAVGGNKPASGREKRHQAIGDGPTKDTYGWLKCNWRRDFGLSNVDIADCITFLAQAIYLQSQGKDTYWTTGEVDPKTLRPQYL